MGFIWFVIGFVVVAAVYFLTGQSLDPWPALDAAGVVAGAYMLAVTIYATRKPFPLKSRIVVLIFCIGFLVAAASFSRDFRETTAWQKGQLVKILGFIQTGILNNEMSTRLLATLDQYHRQPWKKKTIGQIFGESIPGVGVGKDIYPRGDRGDSLRIYVAGLSHEEVVLVGQATWGKGKNPDFKNYDGKSGMVQLKAVLTAKGVTYESQN